MNEIEKKYFEAFKAYVKENPKLSLFSKETVRKIGILEVKFLTDDDIEREEFGDDFEELMECTASSKFIVCEAKLTHVFSKKEFNISFDLSIPSKEISGYKPDFTITNSEFYELKYAIEIDGHEWHEKTKEQAANDRRKDRMYLKHSYTPVRFTGSEVYHDAGACVRETLEIFAFQFLSLKDGAINYESQF